MHSASAPDFARPVVAASQCLGFAPVRYNGLIIEDAFVQKLARFTDIVEVCPEVCIGLGVPRDPIRMQQSSNDVALVQFRTGRDITADMHAFSRSFIERTTGVDGFILKSRSPSCGIAGVNVLDSNGGATGVTRPGMFAGAVLEGFPDFPIEDEMRLHNSDVRAHFLRRIFALAALRRAAAAGKRSDLVAFHTGYKYLLMAHDPRRMTRLGRMVADSEISVTAAFADYAAELRSIIATPPSQGGQKNALSHMLGYVSHQLERGERADLVALIDTDTADAARVLHDAIVRHSNDYLSVQAYFQPFPPELA
ncbi:MAG: DUF523 and DUF1722 domain-containing protein [Longimicrobiales bacterium]